MAPAAFCIALVAVSHVSAVESLVRIGGEFQANAHTDAIAPPSEDVAMRDDGSFIVVWSSWYQDGSGLGAFGRFFDSTGAAQSSEFQINTATDGSQGYPTVATRDDGSFVVAWNQTAPSTIDIVARRFDSLGAPLASEFLVNDITGHADQRPVLAMEADGDFVVIWASNTGDGDYSGVFGRRFDSSGAAIGGQFQVNTFTPGYQGAPAVGMDGDGDFVVTWSSASQAPTQRVFGQRFDASGARLASEFEIDGFTQHQGLSAVAVHPAGDFVVVWVSLGPEPDTVDLFARRFDSAGTPQPVFQVNAYTPYPQSHPVAAMNADGAFIVAWSSPLLLPSVRLHVYARRFDASGTPVTDDVLVDSTLSDSLVTAAAASRDDGTYVVVWHTPAEGNANGGEVFGQLLGSEAAVLDVDSNGSVQALADGLLVLRFLFGFSGSTLTTGAVGPRCARCVATTLADYLTSRDDLDIDGNGDLDALTDGILIVRYLFGLRGVTLTSGAVGAGCVRCDAATIEPYLGDLVAVD